MQNVRSLEAGARKMAAFVTLLAILSLLFQVNPVMAHAALVQSDPPRRASLSLPPKQIQLWFNEKIDGLYASVTVLIQIRIQSLGIARKSLLTIRNPFY